MGAMILLLVCAGTADASTLGPVPPNVDLRNMLTRYVTERSCATLDATATRRHDAFAAGNWQAWRDNVRRAAREALGPLPADTPLNARPVSRHERPDFAVENVLFESFPGVDVNASVFLPNPDRFPPPWPAVVVPTGHSAKTQPSHQGPPQVFARCGYAAVVFDSPAMGEKGTGNDHFRDGVRCYLTGQSSNRYFVADALRCIDYLATRPDVDLGRGVAITGVSGGGITTLFATLLDDRIRASGPACCAVPNALHPVLDGYAPCPETLAFGRFSAYDDPDLIAAALPTPTLLMAGAADEVFAEEMSRRIAADAANSYRGAGMAERFGFFLDPGGHAYTTAMALEFVKWMDRWIRGKERELPAADALALDLLPAEMLDCKPAAEGNMFTLNRRDAESLRTARNGQDLAEAARRLARVDGAISTPAARTGEPSLVWFHYLQEIALEPEPGIELPATFLYPAGKKAPGSALLYFDDRGRWTDLRSQGPLTRIARFIDEGADGPAVLSVDLRGWGDTRPADTRYDLAGWGHRERWLAYVSAALGDPVLAMRIRDGLAALAWLRTRPEVDAARIVVGGRGMGGIVALHMAAIDGRVAGAFSWEGLASFESLAQADAYEWSPEAFLPGVLAHYDLTDLVKALPMPVLVANPRDARRQPLSQEAATALYDPSCIALNADADAIKAFIDSAVKRE